MCLRTWGGGWLVGCASLASLPALCLAVTRESGQSRPLETVQRGTEWGCLSVSVCAPLSLSLGRGAEIARQFWRIRGIAEDGAHCEC